VGWDHDTSALNAEVLEDGQWLADVDALERDRRAMLEAAMGRDDWQLLIWVSTATDRVAHMFYRLIDPEHPRYDAVAAAAHGDAIEDEYRRMDETIGWVVGRLRPNDTLLILSDHGFHNYRRGLHVNQWLRQEGLLALRDGADTGDLLANADWSATKAYAIGTGQIYLNLRGRERDGIVSRDDAQALMDRIRTGLMAIRDGERGDAAVVTEVYFARDVFQGRRSPDAPDMQIAFAENYRTSWESILGGVPAGLFADNRMKWSGDHAASDVRETPGILISNRPLRDEVEIVDLAPTALTFFGRRPPSSYVGESVLAETAATAPAPPR
jgi:predicted AlkP superfamily phosphohydrolase/phosphomutase